MDGATLLAAFDAEVRRSTRPDGTGAALAGAGRVLRRLAPPGQDGSGVLWSGLDAETAPAAIAAEVAFFAARGEQFEWKLYDYDRPANLPELLTGAGLVAGPAEMMMTAPAARVAAGLGAAPLPDGVTLVRATGPAGVAALTQVYQEVFGGDDRLLAGSLLAQLASDPERVDVVLAMAGASAVAAGRIEYVAGSGFAGLWGGGTLPAWRRRGIYQALIGYRAALAAARGYRYLIVDAGPGSQPILERAGFCRLAVTTPYVWTPGTKRPGTVG